MAAASVVVDNGSDIILIDTMDLAIIGVGRHFFFSENHILHHQTGLVWTFDLRSWSMLKHICFIC